MTTMIEVEAKRSGEPTTLHLMENNKPIGSAVWHRNTQSYRVRCGDKMYWASTKKEALKLFDLFIASR